MTVCYHVIPEILYPKLGINWIRIARSPGDSVCLTYCFHISSHNFVL